MAARHWAAGIGATALVALVTVACTTAPAAPPAVRSTTPTAGHYTISSGTGPLAVATALTKAYTTKYPEVTFTFEDPGTTDVGTANVAAGRADIQFASRTLAPNEERGLTILPVGLSGTAVIVHPANGVRGLSKEQLRAIFSGAVTNWSSVGGAAGPIAVIARETSKATRVTFDEYVFGGTGSYTPAAVIVPDIETMVKTVAANSAAIGMATLDARTSGESSIRLLTVDGVAPSKETLTNGTYPIRRPLLLIYSDKAAPAGIHAFVDFVRSPEGQAITAAF